MAKKSLYLFLTSLLGVFLFLILHRIVVFSYLFLLLGGYLTPSLNYYEFLALDYFTLMFALMLGSWYGIWLGLYWYDKVYQEKSQPGFLSHVAARYFPSRDDSLQTRVAAVKAQLENDVKELATAAVELEKPFSSVITQPEPIKRKVVRKRTVKKLNKI